MGLKLTPLCLIFLFAYRIARGYEEVFNSQARRPMGTPRETLTASSLVPTMTTKEPRLYNS